MNKNALHCLLWCRVCLSLSAPRVKLAVTIEEASVEYNLQKYGFSCIVTITSV